MPSNSKVATEILCRSKPLIFVMYNFFKPSTKDVMNDATSGFSAWPDSKLKTAADEFIYYCLQPDTTKKNKDVVNK